MARAIISITMDNCESTAQGMVSEDVAIVEQVERKMRAVMEAIAPMGWDWSVRLTTIEPTQRRQ